MVQIERDDLVRALKSFKGLAKQDLLADETGSQAEYRKTHAVARREIYTKLIDLVESSGIQNACVFAFQEYRDLMADGGFLTGGHPTTDPISSGHFQALEMFFNVLGVGNDQLRSCLDESFNLDQILDASPAFQDNLCMQ